MISISRELELRKKESNNVISFLEQYEKREHYLDNNDKLINEILLRTTLKASTIIMLYNSVESTITQCIEKIHSEIINTNVSYSNLNDNIQKLVLMYYESAIANSNDLQEIVTYKQECLQFTNDKMTFNISLKELFKHYSLFSGNLDSKQIKTILNKYGFDFQESQTELKTIKEYRNQLGHGEKSFEEVGRELSVQQIRAMHTNAFRYLEKVIGSVTEYINQKKYQVI